MKKIIALLLVVSFFVGCTSIARVSDFESDASLINFDRFIHYQNGVDRIGWTWEGENEYFFTVSSVTKSELSELLQKSLDNFGYSVAKVSDSGTAIIGKKGIRLNEWWSVIGVYFSQTAEGYAVYVKVKITQDITGGWIENRAKEFGKHFCAHSRICNNA